MLEPEAETQARRLAEAVGTAAGEDLHARFLLGWFHTYRYQATPEVPSWADLPTAVAMFAPCLLAGIDPERLPEPLLPAIVREVVPTAVERLERALASSDLDLITACATLFERMIAATPDDRPEQAVFVSCLGSALVARATRTGTTEDFDEAVRAAEKALEAATPGHPHRALLASNLCDVLRIRHEQTGTKADLARAVRVGRLALAAASPDAPHWPAHASSLSNALRILAQETGSEADSAEAVRWSREALGHAQAGDPRRPGLLSNLAAALMTRAQVAGSTAELDEAVLLLEEAGAAAPPGHPDHAGVLSNLATAVRLRFDRTGTVADLDGAVDRLTALLGSLHSDHADRALFSLNLGGALLDRFERGGAPDDLDAATRHLRAALTEMPPGHPRRALVASEVSVALRRRFEWTRSTRDLDLAVEAAEQVLAALRHGESHPLSRLASSYGLLHLRFERTGDASGLDEAVTEFARMVDATPGGPDRAGYSSSVSMALLARFERTDALPDLDESVRFGREATAHRDHPKFASHSADLGFALQARYQRTGSPADLDEAVSCFERAAAACPTGGLEWIVHTTDLGNVLRSRFEATGMSADLDDAVRLYRETLAADASGDWSRSLHLVNLGTALAVRSARTGDGADLEEAVRLNREALDLTPARHQRRARRLAVLGRVLGTRFERTGRPEDLDEAIRLFREALAVGGESAAERAATMSGLGTFLQLRSEERADAADFGEALRLHREALALTPADHRERVWRLGDLAAALEDQSRRSGDPSCREEALDAWGAAARLAEAPPSARIRAAWSAARRSAGARPSWAAELLAEAVELLPTVAPRELARGDQQHQLGGFAGLAADAAALALADPAVPVHERPARALRLLEAGRGVLLSQALEVRNDLTELARVAPGLTARFVCLRDRLDDVPSPLETAESARTVSGREGVDRRRLARELSAVMDEIRSLEGFGSFALPPSVRELREQARHGPVVVLNVSPLRSDALLLTRDAITSLPLPGLTPDAVRDQVVSFHEALAVIASPGTAPDEKKKAEERLTGVLRWLWDAAAGPVLDALGYDGPPARGERPRLWWVPGGLMSLLPLHAAGHPTDGPGGRMVLDRVVSSHTPTLTALRHARRRTHLQPAGTEALIVAMPTTPGLPGHGRLGFVREEARMLADRLEGATCLTEPEPGSHSDATPTLSTVIAHLADHPVVHFACHGITDAANPSRSRLLLHDHESAPLTVALLGSLNLHRARLAYLSACETAATASIRLADEAVHVASAFQLTGYPHVIATLWAVNDMVAAGIADAFYATLTAGGPLDPAQAAYALHQAVRAVRDAHPTRPSLWAAHIHTGA
ncbi:hypothetical protein BKA00_001143 [Actinomadura coerulea]|uniref:CHAT domain-containing protein n=1 Tax=Actinomadura coerulea TaxID=46159 RepID=A0A7X0FVA3_9ACTN|nr:CHAT domain-containing tetratricopeptide repeat protein [Actinomadura coerulea]MBB6394229.1 hypothetical protein [Actinomadura coerulea]GGQ21153.1 CHAT domain-containing protein [Actinomadura coerulea]